MKGGTNAELNILLMEWIGGSFISAETKMEVAPLGCSVGDRPRVSLDHGEWRN